MRAWGPERLAAAAGADVRLAPRAQDARTAQAGPRGVSIDSRAIAPGELFVGLRGERTDGGAYAAAALAAGAWGVLVAPDSAPAGEDVPQGAAVLVHEEPLAALGQLAREWRRELGAGGARVVAITGSTGKTSTKDILAAMLRTSLRTAATPANLNTEIGLPLTVLSAPADTECLVLELAMRGPGQIAELTAIAEPDVGVIVNVGTAHLELLGTREAIAAAKAELIAGLRPGAAAVVPAGEPLLAPHLREDVRTITFGAPEPSATGDGADVWLLAREAGGRVRIAVDAGAGQVELRPSFSQTHNLGNLLAAVAAAGTLGVRPGGDLNVEFSPGRGQLLELADGVAVIDDCYNANPMSMRAAIDELARAPARRRVAVLGDMLELGRDAPALHREIGAHAAAAGVDVLIAVGGLATELGAGYGGELHLAPDAAAAATLAAELVAPGDTVLVKASRGVGLERVVERLAHSPALSGGGRR
ncbi:MAG TPA: UDP-N-acetylmuramoyl-tripeptide--D-alanyl-D-alanine ligase [Solirubrobacteraceae bacterium]|nr:UDP-N-acetylmuramoyl-tripeptide--D-alanyl-D-alanine ligase [Solirubrobacteraceae bacterium]